MIRRAKKILLTFLFILAAAVIYFDFQYEAAANPNWGLNFSLTHAQYLGFDWRKMYIEMLDDLKPKRLRVMALWEVIEPERGKYNFEDIDFILQEAGERGAEVMVT